MSITENDAFAPILIVEDEEDHSRLIIKALSEAGCLINKIYLVENGQEAINFLTKKEKYKDDTSALPALILLDLKMPMKNGFDVLKEIKSDDRLKRIPIIMLSTSSTSEDIVKALSLGANDYIVKPVKFRDFTSKVNKLGYYWSVVSDVKRVCS